MLSFGAEFSVFQLVSENVKFKIQTAVFPVVLYGREMWFLTYSEEYKLGAFENRVLRRILEPKRDEETGERRRLHKEEPHDLYCSPDVIRVIK